MRFKTLIAMLALVTLTYAQEGNPTMHLTLDKAIELALSENPTMKVAEQEIQLKEVSKREAWQNLLPTVTIDGTISYNIKVAEIKTSTVAQTSACMMRSSGHPSSSMAPRQARESLP